MLRSVNRKEKDALSVAHINDLCTQLGSVEMKDEFLQNEDVFNCPDTFRKHSVEPVTIYAKDRDGDTLLHIAIILLDVKFIMLFISKTPSYKLLSLKNLLFQSPLHLAVLTCQPEVTRRLVVGGADIESRDKNGNTALHIACREGYQKIVHCLLEPVRYQETKQNTYEIPYQTIPQDFTIKNYEGLTCLHLSALNNHRDIVKTLIDNNIDVNMKEGKTGRTILHNACHSGDISLAKLLIRERSCDINVRAYDGSTPFDLARVRRHDLVCVALAAAGARYGDEFSDSDE